MSPERTRTLPHLLDIDAVAEHLGVSTRHVRRLVSERRIPFLKWGHLLRFDPREVSAWLDERRRPACHSGGLPSEASRGTRPAQRPSARKS